jgi:glycosyltransferase involved in cell wall biosynthesis
MQNNYKAPQAAEYDMLVFCHLRWEFVYQRPQHLISRLSAGRRVLFIEEPIPFLQHEKNTAKIIEVRPNLHILQLRVESIAAIKNVLPQYISNKKIPVGWFYSAAFECLISEFSFGKIVYDCMDELSLFRGAPAELIEQEKKLLEKADIVFTGGKSLYESKSKMHTNVYCFPSSVDQEHFSKAMNGIAVPEDIAHIPQPIVGYYGVIDERIDLPLLHEVALNNPHVSFVMIGPLAKISDNDLPRANNIYYPGMKSYKELPGYLKAFRVAMMPFAMNDSTRYISPTKTLEYMAGNKPIISTPVHDVVRDYSHCVSIVENANSFTKALQEIIKTETTPQLDKHFDEVLKATSWDATAKKMNELLMN